MGSFMTLRAKNVEVIFHLSPISDCPINIQLFLRPTLPTDTESQNIAGIIFAENGNPIKLKPAIDL